MTSLDPNFLIMLEINLDLDELRAYGLTEEEIEGYLDFYIENYPLTNKERMQ